MREYRTTRFLERISFTQAKLNHKYLWHASQTGSDREKLGDLERFDLEMPNFHLLLPQLTVFIYGRIRTRSDRVNMFVTTIASERSIVLVRQDRGDFLVYESQN